ncbi:MAG: hypothetical protein L3J70_02915 [Gammaproteobacteria bacterium]|nr:hypothetical protein [Gammaproteobacteria bacterium]
MSKINTIDSGHGSKTEHYAGGTTIQYNVFCNGTDTEKAHLKKLNEAYNIINKFDAKIDLQGPCNKYFRTLSKRKAFHHFWRDNTIFINYSPSVIIGFYGATHSNDKDICISAWCLGNTNRWMVAATIIHELAHIGGAPGGASHAAEKAADKCGFKPQYNPAILGSIKQLGDYLENLA